MKAKYGNLAHVEVTKEEFIQRMMATGVTKEKAESHATISKLMGSSVMIGEEMVSIKADGI
jgi:hypothetical protein